MIQLFTINHERAPLLVREQLALTDKCLVEWQEALDSQASITGSVLLSTCHRFECYLHTTTNQTSFIKEKMRSCFNFNGDQFDRFVDVKTEQLAVQHLYEVTTGLQAAIKGETQILGQVKQAYFAAQANGSTDKEIHRLFQSVLHFAKDMHKKTGINNHPISLSRMAYQFAAEKLSKERLAVVILGAGKMAKLAIEYITGTSNDMITVLNRSKEALTALNQQFDVTVADLSTVSDQLENADLIISTLNVDQPFLTASMLQTRSRKKPLMIIDLSVPRSVEASVGLLEEISSYNLDDLAAMIDHHAYLRRDKADLIQQAIERAVPEVYRTVFQQSEEALKTLFTTKSQHLDQLMASVANKLPGLTAREQQVIEDHLSYALHLNLKPTLDELKKMNKQ